MWVLVLGLQTGTVPAVGSELVLTLVDGDLHTLNGRCRHVRVLAAQVVLVGCQLRVGFAHRVGV